MASEQFEALVATCDYVRQRAKQQADAARKARADAIRLRADAERIRADAGRQQRASR